MKILIEAAWIFLRKKKRCSSLQMELVAMKENESNLNHFHLRESSFDLQTRCPTTSKALVNMAEQNQKYCKGSRYHYPCSIFVS